jgi:cell division initiation protein
MKVSPLDLRQVRFRTAFRGFDKAEVLALIAEVTDDYENALKDVDKLRQDVSKMEALLNQHREHERDLRDTLMTAQRVSDDIRANAEAQARNIIREAEGRSDLLLEKAQSRLEDVQREIDGMKMKRREAETTLESTIASLRNTLEFVREQEQREREEKILLHRPRPAEGQPDATTIDKRRAAAGNAWRLSALLRLPAKTIHVVSGMRSRNKVVMVLGVPAARVLRAISLPGEPA